MGISRIYNVFTRAIAGLVPASGGSSGTTKFLREDGTFNVPSAAGSTNQVQYNSSGSFAGSSGLAFDGNTLTNIAGTAASVGNVSRGTTSQTGDLRQNQDVNANILSGFSSNGSLFLNGETITQNNLPVPTGLAITTAGTAGATTYGYRVAAVNAQGTTLACTTATTTTGNATLSGTNYTILTWNSVAGATSYKVHGRTSGSELFMVSVNSTGAATYTYNDTLAVATPAGALPGNPVGTGFTVNMWSGQSGVPFVVKDSTGAVKFSISTNGNLNMQGSGGVAGNRVQWGTTSAGIGFDGFNLGFYDSNGTRQGYVGTSGVNFSVVGQNSQTLTDGSSIAWNIASGALAQVTLGGARTLSNPTNIITGGAFSLRLVQDGTGSRTIATYGGAFKFPSATPPTLSTTAGAVDVLTFTSFDGSTLLFTGIQKALS